MLKITRRPNLVKLFFILVLLLFCADGHINAQTTQSNNNAQLEQEITKILREIYDTLSRDDIEAYKSKLDENMISVNQTGGVSTKAQLVARYNPPPAGTKYSAEISNLKVYGTGDVVTTNYDIAHRFITGNSPEEVRRARYTDVFIRSNGSWKLLTSSFIYPPEPANAVVAGMPVGWRKTPLYDGRNYSMTVDTNVKRGGKTSASVKSTCVNSSNETGSLGQEIVADSYRGKRVRLSGWMKTQDAERAHIWMRIDGNQRLLGFDNMSNRPVIGTTDWKKYEIVLDVPQEAVNIIFGMYMDGKGQVWLDDFQLEVVGNNVAVTNLLSAERMQRQDGRNPKRAENSKPINLDFESGFVQ